MQTIVRALYTQAWIVCISLNIRLANWLNQFYLKGGKCLFLDEVHKYPSWSKEIKNIYDEFPELKIVFTGSSLLQLLNAEADLSRRCISYNMQGLSYREYLKLFHQIHILPLYIGRDLGEQ